MSRASEEQLKLEEIQRAIIHSDILDMQSNEVWMKGEVQSTYEQLKVIATEIRMKQVYK